MVILMSASMIPDQLEDLIVSKRDKGIYLTVPRRW